MKISAIESLRQAASPRQAVVRVHAGDGLVGPGETVDKLPGSVAALHDSIAPLVPGQDARPHVSWSIAQRGVILSHRLRNTERTICPG